MLIELLNYFLRRQNRVGVLDDQHYFSGRNNDEKSGETLYERHGWEINPDTRLLEFNN